METVRTLVVGVLLFLVLRVFLIQTYTITSGSMESTLLVGDFLVLNKLAYGALVPGTGMRTPGYSSPRNGDVIVFRGRHEPIDLVKRIVGLPGDTLEMRAGTLLRNGEPLEEPYATAAEPGNDGWHPGFEWQREFAIGQAGAVGFVPTLHNWGPLVVPEHRFFVLGDNRDDSLDSRYYGFILESDVKGRAAGLYFSWDRAAAAAVPVFGQIRWDRLGERVR
jgi:signal peptidase I